jgi:hypothetical protein
VGGKGVAEWRGGREEWEKRKKGWEGSEEER